MADFYSHGRKALRTQPPPSIRPSSDRIVSSSVAPAYTRVADAQSPCRMALDMSGKLVKSSSRAWTSLLAKQIYIEAPVELEITQTEGRTRFADAHAGSAAARPPSISQVQSNFRILELLGRHLALASMLQTTTRSSTRSSTKSWAWHRGIWSRTGACALGGRKNRWPSCSHAYTHLHT